MFIDARTAEQKAKDSVRCPTCGNRPQDRIDELIKSEMGSGQVYSQGTPTQSRPSVTSGTDR